MRISIIFLATTFSVVQLLRADPGYSQDIDSIQVTIDCKNGSLSETFYKIEKQAPVLFAYQPRQVALYRNIILPKATRTLRKTLDLLFAGTDLQYRQAGNNIIVFRPTARTTEASPLQLAPSTPAEPLFADTLMIIKGKVVDKDGRPIPGAGITIKGRGVNKETGTDETGSFSIRVNSSATHLLIHCVGYQAKELSLSSKKEFYLLSLESSTTTLKDMVVTGVVRRTNESFTGAVSTFTAEQLRTVGNQDVISSLKVLDPSFQVFDNINLGSDPNMLPNVQLRGASNLPDLKGDYTGSPNVPLFILDGFEVPLQKVFDLDMNRIERVTILKDATGTALYGSRGANGVVVINTKQPEPGKLRISYTGDYTLETPDLSPYHLLNGSQKLEAEKAAGLYTGNSPAQQQWLDERYNDRYKEIQRGVNTDWLAQPVRNAFGQRHYLYLDGGDAYLRYAVDLSANNVAGVMKGSGRDTYSGGTMLSYRYKQLLFRNYLSYTYNRDRKSVV